jgi:hypothetical protein
MKPKFIELVDKAGFAIWDDEEWRPKDAFVDWSSNYDKELENFYELIVSECASLVREYTLRKSGVENPYTGAVFIEEEVLKHFGQLRLDD